VIRCGALLALLAWGGWARALNAQGTSPVIELREPGTGIGPELLSDALARPHRVIPPATSRYVLARGVTQSTTLIVLGRDAVIEGQAQGDVVVVGGDLYMHPGGSIRGRAIAVGGSVYESSLGEIVAGSTAFLDFTYDITPTADGYALAYRALSHPGTRWFAWVGASGVALPTYDRSNGLSPSLGPTLRVPRIRLAVEPRITYRSQLGAFDPSIIITDSLSPSLAARLSGGRTTLSNDAWIRSDLINSIEYFVVGDDTRNYYRARHADLTIGGRWRSVRAELSTYAGGRVERADSVRPGVNPRGGPWTLFDRNGTSDRLRPNPAIDPGVTGSFIGGFDWRWSGAGIVARIGLDEELATFTSDCDTCELAVARDFAQTTLDGAVSFPTFGSQTLRVDAHAVVTSHGRTPKQRFAYIGGPGTVPTLGLLEFGGDHLIFADARYAVPLVGLSLPFVGSPTLALRDAVGGAAIGQFPTLHQAIGPRVSVGFLYAEFLVDPVRRTSWAGGGLSVRR
jgi:hypothetical protein